MYLCVVRCASPSLSGSRGFPQACPALHRDDLEYFPIVVGQNKKVYICLTLSRIILTFTELKESRNGNLEKELASMIILQFMERKETPWKQLGVEEAGDYLKVVIGN